jgi:HEPN domain-containing protein
MPTPKQLEEAREWLRFAAEDLDSARVFRDVRPRRVRQFLFCLQQSAEKSLKAFLIANGTPYPLTHDIDRLSRLCSTLDPSLEPLMRECLPLTPFAGLSRYPSERDEPEPDQIDEWFLATDALVAAVIERIA